MGSPYKPATYGRLVSVGLLLRGGFLIDCSLDSLSGVRLEACYRSPSATALYNPSGCGRSQFIYTAVKFSVRITAS